jgi:pSer/pThr/pTyr-binding forkhead associated (FHA) protein
MWRLSIEDDQGNKTVVNLVRDEYTVGRAENNTVRLTERNISRRHARFVRENGRWRIEDVSSYNGVFVNGARVNQGQELSHHDLVQLGDYRLEVGDESATSHADVGMPDSASVAVTRPDSFVDRDRLVMVAGPEMGAEFPLARDLVVLGRGEECDVILNHASVSRVHAEIQSLGDGRYEILDRESANGVRINGVELQRSLLDARDTIELGDIALKFIPAGQIYRPSPNELQLTLAAREEEVFPPASEAPPALAKKGIPLAAKVAAGVVGLGLVALLGTLVLSGTSPNIEQAPRPTSANDTARRILVEARELLQAGDIEGAHQKLSELPENSNARQSAEFREIEARWADSMFAQANDESDLDTRKSLLKQIASTLSVDSARRKRADNEMKALDAEGVDVTELPAAPVRVQSSSTGVVALSPSRPRSTPPSSAPQASETANPSGTPKAVSGGGLVRDNPFDTKSPSVREMATSGDREQLLKAKAQLQAKVSQGTATEADKKLLRGLCKQLGDASCSN